MFKACAVIPVYNHQHAIGAVVAAVLARQVHCILVDDASDAECAATLAALAAESPSQVTLLRHSVNQGKGGAVLSGFERAAALGYTHALQIDADGQHDTGDIPRFLAIAETYPEQLISGCPQYDASVPKLRLYARYLTHVWIWINTLSLAITDSMCGFRVYPLAPTMALHRRHHLGRHMDFDSDVVVRLYWSGLHVINVPTRVRYPTDGVSHFRMVLDNALISRLHARHFLGMLPRIPRLILRHFGRRLPHTLTDARSAATGDREQP
ncbi:MAG: glycosyltransferase family 2 protein [Herbaspirillum sp.]|jgi:glycosyltransferase involved in cell wall biosynthesis|nr:glycosyltransferase family 2 protein [Herbaspirillum sp.]